LYAYLYGDKFFIKTLKNKPIERNRGLAMRWTKKEKIYDFLKGRYMACLATENEDDSIHLTSVWYLFENGFLYIVTNSGSRKARNVLAHPKASVMVDSRKTGRERGVAISGDAQIVTGEPARDLALRIRRRYLSEAAIADPRVGGVLAAVDTVIIRITPKTWVWWDMSLVDKRVFSGLLNRTPSYILPLDQ